MFLTVKDQLHRQKTSNNYVQSINYFYDTEQTVLPYYYIVRPLHMVHFVTLCSYSEFQNIQIRNLLL